MQYFLVTAINMSRGPKKTYHGPFVSRTTVESAAIAALSTAKYDQVTIEKDKEDKDKEDED